MTRGDAEQSTGGAKYRRGALKGRAYKKGLAPCDRHHLLSMLMTLDDNAISITLVNFLNVGD